MGAAFFSTSSSSTKKKTKKNEQTRLAKYYVPLDDASKRALEYDVHRLTAGRDSKLSNVVEVSEKMKREREEKSETTTTTATTTKEIKKTLNLVPLSFSFKKKKKKSTVQDLQDHLPPLRGPLLLHRLRPLGQRARPLGSSPPLRRGPRPLFRQRLRARPRLQLPPSLFDSGRVCCRRGGGAVEQEGDPGEARRAGQDRDVKRKRERERERGRKRRRKGVLRKERARVLVFRRRADTPFSRPLSLSSSSPLLLLPVTRMHLRRF